MVPEKFFDQFPQVLANIAPLPGEEALYSNFRALMDAAAKDPEIKKLLTETAVAAEKEVIKPFFEWKHNGHPAGNGWTRSENNAKADFDYFNRTGTAKSNMFDNKPNETQSFYTDNDASGASLEGSGTCAITFAKGEEPPVNGFWSLTLYNEQHFFPSERSQALFARDQEQDAPAQCGRLTNTLRRRQVTGQRQGVELAAGARGSFLPLHPRLLGQRTDPRWLVETAGREEGQLSPITIP